jgi:hypothetical protein
MRKIQQGGEFYKTNKSASQNADPMGDPAWTKADSATRNGSVRMFRL